MCGISNVIPKKEKHCLGYSSLKTFSFARNLHPLKKQVGEEEEGEEEEEEEEVTIK